MRVSRASLAVAVMVVFAVMSAVTATTTVMTTISVTTTSTLTAAPAPLVTDDPPAAHYVAVFPQGGSQAVVGQCDAETPTNTTVGTFFTFNVNGDPESGGPFLYHIHENPVPANGSCDATGEHLDPEARGVNPPCNASAPETCQVGDLSGKHGDIPALPGFSLQYIDDYVSLNPDDAAFLGNRSLVIHDNNGTRIACANWVAAANSTNATNANSTATVNATVTLSTTSTATGTTVVVAGSTTASQPSATANSTGRPKSGTARVAAAIGMTVVGLAAVAVVATALLM